MTGTNRSGTTTAFQRRRFRIDKTARNVPGGTFIFDFYDEGESPVWGDGDDILWPRGEPLMFAAPEGTGKSSLAQQISLRRVGAIPEPAFLGYSVEPLAANEKVLYMAMDRPRQIARSFRRMVEPQERKKLNARLKVWLGPPPVVVTDSHSTFADWVTSEYPGTRDIVIDSLKDLAPGLTNDDVGAGINSAIQELIARGHNVLTLHHNRKQGRDATGKQVSLDDIYGSRWLTGGQGSVFWLEGKPGSNVIEVIHLKPVVNIVPKFKVVHNHAKGISTLFRGEADLARLLLAHRKEGVTVKQAALGLYQTTHDEDKQKARRGLARLVKEGVAYYEPGAAGGAGGGAKEARWFLISR